ncbi:MAG: hypothetical protein AAB833_01820, partial [Patescibacteria group bacterium]
GKLPEVQPEVGVLGQSDGSFNGAVGQNNSVATKFNFSNKQLLIGLAVVLVVGFFYNFRGLFIAATVNGEMISRREFNAEVQRMVGTKVLDQLVIQKLITQTIKSQGVVIDTQAVQSEIDVIKAGIEGTGITFEEALEKEGVVYAELVENIRIKLGLKGLLADKIVVTEEEIDAYILARKIEVTEETKGETRNTIKTQLEQEKFDLEVGPYLEGLKTEAKLKTYIKF